MKKQGYLVSIYWSKNYLQVKTYKTKVKKQTLI